MKRHDFSRLRTSANQTFHLDKLILLHLRVGSVCTRIWFENAPYLALNIFLGTALINRFNRRIFSAEEKIVLMNSQPDAKLAHSTQNTEVKVVDLSKAKVE